MGDSGFAWRPHLRILCCCTCSRGTTVPDYLANLLIPTPSVRQSTHWHLKRHETFQTKWDPWLRNKLWILFSIIFADFLISSKTELQMQDLQVSVCSLFGAPSRATVTLNIQNHTKWFCNTESVFVRRFLQTTQAKQLDVKKKKMHTLPQE